MEVVVSENREPRTRVARATRVDACRSRISIREFDELIVDEPLTAGGGDTGPTPLEYACASLASCQIVTIEKIAQSLDFHCVDLNATVSADVNFVSVRPDMSPVPRFIRVRVVIEIVSDEPEARHADLVSRIEARCPVSALFRDASIDVTFDWKWKTSAGERPAAESK